MDYIFTSEETFHLLQFFIHFSKEFLLHFGVHGVYGKSRLRCIQWRMSVHEYSYIAFMHALTVYRMFSSNHKVEHFL